MEYWYINLKVPPVLSPSNYFQSYGRNKWTHGVESGVVESQEHSNGGMCGMLSQIEKFYREWNVPLCRHRILG